MLTWRRVSTLSVCCDSPIVIHQDMLLGCKLHSENSKLSLDTVQLAKTGKLGSAFKWVGGNRLV